MADAYSFHLVDGVAIAVVGLSAIMALYKGFVNEVLSVVAWVAAIFAALYLHKPTYPFWHKMISNEMLAHIVTFAAVFIGVLSFLMIIAKNLSQKVDSGSLGSVDRSLGFVYGGLRGALIMSLVYMLVTGGSQDQEDKIPTWLEDAKSVPIMEEGAKVVIGLLPKQMRAPVAEEANIAGVEPPKKKDFWSRMVSKNAGSGESYSDADRKELDAVAEDADN